MIDLALDLLRRRLDDHLMTRFGVEDPLVVLGPPTDGEGKPTAEARNRLALFLTNIAEDTVPRGRPKGLARQLVQAEPVHLDLYVMLASSYDAEIYGEGLKLISAAMTFFQSHPVFTPLTAPEMPPGLSQLTVEIANLGAEDVAQIWGNMGGRYLPSVLYKVRSVVIDGNV
ncbi:MAG: DUF4255 domain-containing protein, partial [Pseudomonadota bacterium]